MVAAPYGLVHQCASQNVDNIAAAVSTVVDAHPLVIEDSGGSAG